MWPWASWVLSLQASEGSFFDPTETPMGDQFLPVFSNKQVDFGMNMWGFCQQNSMDSMKTSPVVFLQVGIRSTSVGKIWKIISHNGSLPYV